MPTLENWEVKTTQHTYPQVYYLDGTVSDSAVFPFRFALSTAPVIAYSQDADTGIYYVTTLFGAVYQLGKPRDDASFIKLRNLPLDK